MKIALVSLNQIWEDKEANKINCLAYIEESSNHNVELIIFPEMTLTGFSMNTQKTAEDVEDSESINWFKNQARIKSVNIVFGVVLRAEEKAKNFLYFVDKNGNVLADYAKIHPFSYSGEDRFFVGGKDLKYATLEQVIFGLTICYDLRFPELYQALSKNCEIVLNIANWPQRRVDHWNTLLKARAIENQVYMIGVNRIGIDGNNIEYEKSSMIFTPNGDKLEPVYSNELITIFEFEPLDVIGIRNNFPVKNDRRIAFYKSIL